MQFLSWCKDITFSFKHETSLALSRPTSPADSLPGFRNHWRQYRTFFYRITPVVFTKTLELNFPELENLIIAINTNTALQLLANACHEMQDCRI